MFRANKPRFSYSCCGACPTLINYPRAWPCQVKVRISLGPMHVEIHSRYMLPDSQIWVGLTSAHPASLFLSCVISMFELVCCSTNRLSHMHVPTGVKPNIRVSFFSRFLPPGTLGELSPMCEYSRGPSSASRDKEWYSLRDKGSSSWSSVSSRRCKLTLK